MTHGTKIIHTHGLNQGVGSKLQCISCILSEEDWSFQRSKRCEYAKKGDNNTKNNINNVNNKQVNN